MLTQPILEQLKARAYATDGAAAGDALADLVNWIALRASRLDEHDMSVMMSAALALYKIEIEKNWETSASDLAAGPAESTESTEPTEPASPLPANTPQAANDPASTIPPAPDHPSAKHVAAEAGIAALVALRRPAAAAAAAAQNDAPAQRGGRRWTDTGHWALTLR